MNGQTASKNLVEIQKRTDTFTPTNSAPKPKTSTKKYDLIDDVTNTNRLIRNSEKFTKKVEK
jgi:hypothetical protein